MSSWNRNSMHTGGGFEHFDDSDEPFDKVFGVMQQMMQAFNPNNQAGKRRTDANADQQNDIPAQADVREEAMANATSKAPEKGCDCPPKMSMLSNLVQRIAQAADNASEDATPSKLYLRMAQSGAFDADAGVTMTQLIDGAKTKGFIVEKNGPNGRYLQLADV